MGVGAPDIYDRKCITVAGTLVRSGMPLGERDVKKYMRRDISILRYEPMELA